MITRHQEIDTVRQEAAELAARRPHPRHSSNGDELRYRDDVGQPTHIANFTKGLPHTQDGSLVDAAHFQLFVQGIQSGDPKDFERTPLGPVLLKDAMSDQVDCLRRVPETDDKGDFTFFDKDPCPDLTRYWYSQAAREANEATGAKVRAWESAGAGHVFDLQGPDAQAVTMPPAPTLESSEFAAETAEVYAMALLRDTHVKHFKHGAVKVSKKHLHGQKKSAYSVADAVEDLNGTFIELDAFYGEDETLGWFGEDPDRFGPAEQRRLRAEVTPQTIFRGTAPGDTVGPYLSQFLLVGNTGINGNDTVHDVADGYVSYGALRVDQRVRVATPCKDYLTTWEAWLDVQNGADLRGSESYLDAPHDRRFITTPRDLATYVHYDALYEAYLNACLFLLGKGVPFDRGIPFQAADNVDKQQGFAHFGAPHILTLVTEVATRALKAVRFQKFNSHRRLRPEGIGGLVDRAKEAPESVQVRHLKPLVDALERTGLLEKVKHHNAAQNATFPDRAKDGTGQKDRYLLPMAFPEGSPMHPSYGAGHATVAGACVTILKAYFDHGHPLDLGKEDEGYVVYEPADDGKSLTKLHLDKPLTVEGELNKLAANIAIGRNWAGVHFHTDYIESLRMGEQIALGILEEQKLTYQENFTMTVPLYDGGIVRI